MGRPLNHRYFGDLNIYATGTEVGGEGIASVTAPAGTLASLVNGTYTIPPASIGAPSIAGGVKATLAVVVTGTTTYTVTVLTAGAGYTSAPTITFNGSIAGGSGSATPVATLTSGAAARDNTISVTAWIPAAGAAGYISGTGGTASTANGDIFRQVGTRSYVVQTSEGVGRCTLVTATPAAGGQMIITASDSTGTGNYYVTKLTNRKAYLTRQSSGSGWEFATGAVVPWTFGTATLNTTVKIDNN